MSEFKPEQIAINPPEIIPAVIDTDFPEPAMSEMKYEGNI